MKHIAVVVIFLLILVTFVSFTHFVGTILDFLWNFLIVQQTSSTPVRESQSYDYSDELILDTVKIPQKSTMKRDAPEENRYLPRPRREYGSTRTQFYSLLLDIIKVMQTSTKNEIRSAKERDLQRHSIQRIGSWGTIFLS